MGYTRVKAVVANPTDRVRTQEVELLVDTGAIYSILPEGILGSLGIEPSGKRRCRLANGKVEEYLTGEAYVEVQGIGVTSIVVFGTESTIPLLGITTLELLGLQVDPVSGTLKPMELLLLHAI